MFTFVYFVLCFNVSPIKISLDVLFGVIIPIKTLLFCILETSVDRNDPRTVRLSLCLSDSLVCLEGNGPSEGGGLSEYGWSSVCGSVSESLLIYPVCWLG